MIPMWGPCYFTYERSELGLSMFPMWVPMHLCIWVNALKYAQQAKAA